MLKIKKRVEMCYISGEALRAQRQAAGLSQQSLSDLIAAATGIEVGQMRISRMEKAFESPVEPVIAGTLVKIFSAKQ